MARYVLEQRIGEGGMAEVFRARAEGPSGFARVCAVKRLLQEGERDPSLRARFLDEARIAARLRHPCVVAVVDFYEEAGRFHLVMEHVEGLSAERLVATARLLSAADAAFIAHETARALACAHGAGVVHRDVSLSNLLLSQEGEVKLADFGLATARERLARTEPGTLFGKAAYLSPERRRGQPARPADDLWALGVVVRRLLGAVDPRERSREPAPSLEALARRLTHADMRARPRDADEVVALLAAMPKSGPARIAALVRPRGATTGAVPPDWETTTAPGRAAPAVAGPVAAAGVRADEPVPDELSEPTRTETAAPDADTGGRARAQTLHRSERTGHTPTGNASAGHPSAANATAANATAANATAADATAADATAANATAANATAANATAANATAANAAAANAAAGSTSAVALLRSERSEPTEADGDITAPDGVPGPRAQWVEAGGSSRSQRPEPACGTAHARAPEPGGDACAPQRRADAFARSERTEPTLVVPEAPRAEAVPPTLRPVRLASGLPAPGLPSGAPHRAGAPDRARDDEPTAVVGLQVMAAAADADRKPPPLGRRRTRRTVVLPLALTGAAVLALLAYVALRPGS